MRPSGYFRVVLFHSRHRWHGPKEGESEREEVKEGGIFSVPDLGQSDLNRDAVRGSTAAGSQDVSGALSLLSLVSCSDCATLKIADQTHLQRPLEDQKYSVSNIPIIALLKTGRFNGLILERNTVIIKYYKYLIKHVGLSYSEEQVCSVCPCKICIPV